MNPIFSNKKLIGWVIGIITALALIMYSITYGSNIVTQGVNDVTNILGRLVSYPANSINDFIDSVSDLSNTYQENQSLKQKIEGNAQVARYAKRLYVSECDGYCA